MAEFAYKAKRSDGQPATGRVRAATMKYQDVEVAIADGAYDGSLASMACSAIHADTIPAGDVATGVGVSVGGTGVSVGGTGVSVGGTGVSVGGTGVNVAVGGTGVGVAVG